MKKISAINRRMSENYQELTEKLADNFEVQDGKISGISDEFIRQLDDQIASLDTKIIQVDKRVDKLTVELDVAKTDLRLK